MTPAATHGVQIELKDTSCGNNNAVHGGKKKSKRLPSKPVLLAIIAAALVALVALGTVFGLQNLSVPFA